MRKRKSRETLLPFPNSTPRFRCLHTCRMRNFDLIDFVEQLLFALR